MSFNPITLTHTAEELQVLDKLHALVNSEEYETNAFWMDFDNVVAYLYQATGELTFDEIAALIKLYADPSPN